MQFIFFDCIMAWHLAHASYKHSQASIRQLTRYCQHQNAFLEHFFFGVPIWKCISSQSCVMLLIFPSIFVRILQAQCETNFSYSNSFSAINQGREENNNNNNNLPAIAFLFVAAIFTRFQSAIKMKKKKKKILDWKKSDGKIIYLIPSLDLKSYSYPKQCIRKK